MRAIKNNPAGDGAKKRRCAKPEDESVTPAVVQQIKDVYDATNSTFDETIDAMVALLKEYVGSCQVASLNWPLKLRKLAQSLNTERCPVGEDCRV